MDIVMYRSTPNKNVCTEVVCTKIVMFRKRPTPIRGLQDNSLTNQLAVSQVVDWITCGLVNSPTANF